MNTRQQDILILAERFGEISIKDLAEKLNVTEMTVHRDLDYLQGERLIHKKRGAAVFVENTKKARLGFYADEKRAIGKTAVGYLQSGQSVIFDNSTTAAECARFLDGELKLTCYTTGLDISNIISNCGSHILYCSGGYYFPESHGFVGSRAEDFVSEISADIAIIGASGISSERGITNPYPMHNSLQKAIIKSAKKRILLADHSKFDKLAMEKTCELSDIDICITDDGISEEVFTEYRKYFNLIIAKGD